MLSFKALTTASLTSTPRQASRAAMAVRCFATAMAALVGCVMVS